MEDDDEEGGDFNLRDIFADFDLVGLVDGFDLSDLFEFFLTDAAAALLLRSRSRSRAVGQSCLAASCDRSASRCRR